MKEKIFETKYSTLYYTPSLKEIEYICFDLAQKISNEEYLFQLAEGTLAMEKVEVEYILTDFREFEIPVSPETQDKIVLNIIPRWNKMGVKKVGIIMPAEFIASLSVEQIVDDSQSVALYSTAYFDNLEKAREWFYNS